MTRDRVRSDLSAEVFDDLTAVETLWRGIETDPGVLATPYQRFDWVSAFLEGSFGADRERLGQALRVVVLREASGAVRLILPLLRQRERGVMVARVVGATHANFHMPLFASRSAAATSGEEIVEALRVAGAEAGIDAYILGHQPRFWDGAVNPLAIRGEPSPSDAYGLLLGPDVETTVKRVFSADARKKLRAKEKKLAEAVGPVGFRVAQDAAEAASFLGAFYRHKASRFAALGILDPYAAEPVRRFLAEAAGAKESVFDRRSIEICALVGNEDGRVYAVFAGAVDAVRYSGMMTAFDQDPALARFSLGEILLQHLVRYQAAQGRRAFDLGVGEARYKASICDETIELRQVAIPVSLSGWLVVAQAQCLFRLKRRIKRSPTLFGLVNALRRRAAS
ncbi:MAG: GNAT family N-acetyltransferase [Methylobacterium sp.]|nr:GNAT family N-acetyltransferase [Methylobacterium sp.]